MPSQEHSPELPFSAENEQPLSHFLPDRSYPLIWIQRLAVYSDWRPTKHTLLRSFKMRRGLNVLWANPSGNDNKENRLSGHSAGKSTFCRLIRYLLTEKNPGTEEFTDAFRDQYTNGWIIGEVFVDNQLWLVGRPLGGSGHHSFAFKGEDLSFDFPESPPRTDGWAQYKAAIEDTLFSAVPNRDLPDLGKALAWEYLLPWLSRDQEAHYSGLLAWRHKDSNSSTPSFSANDRSHIIRQVMGVLGNEEQNLLKTYAQISKKHENKVRDRSNEVRLFNEDKQRLEKVMGYEVPEDDQIDLLSDEIQERADKLRASVGDFDGLKKLHSKELEPLQEKANAIRAKHLLMKTLLDDAETNKKTEEERIIGSSAPQQPAPKPKNEVSSFISGLGPFPGYCSVARDSLKHRDCPHYEEKGLKGEDQEALSAITNDKEKRARQLALYQQRVDDLKPQVEKLKEELDRANKLVSDMENAHRDTLVELLAPRTAAENLTTLYTSYQSSKVNLEKWDKDTTELAEEKDRLDLQIKRASKDHNEKLQRIEEIFDLLAQRLLGTQVHGTVRFKGKSIEPEIHFKGRRNSAALKVAKWLIFDLAALIFSMRDRDSLHPRFLIHDSPRESDLARIIYTELFTVAAELEGNDQSEAPFQYIVTTTEPPPEPQQKSPYIIEPILDSSKTVGRLLGIDLDSALT